MKKFLIIAVSVLFVGALFTSCKQSKPSCPAYSSVSNQSNHSSDSFSK